MSTRNTYQRELVLEQVRSRHDHPSSQEIYEALQKDYPHISQATVYRNLALLVDMGLIKRVGVEGSLPDRFDVRTDPHYHLHCLCCHKIFDAPLPFDIGLDKLIERAGDFKVFAHSITFDGLCPDCQHGISL